MSSTTEPTVDAKTFREVVGHLASGVSVITTQLRGADYGITVSSVTSLSTDPPTMLACLNKAAPTAAAITKAGSFTINILAEDQGHLAHKFATPSDDKFSGVEFARNELGHPLLKDALASLEGRVVEELSGGTHRIFIGQVVRATANPGKPLTYFRGGFGRFQFAGNDSVYHDARVRVLERQYSAGAVLDVKDLAADLDVDATAAFYALTRLASEGLVQRDPDRGYVVVPFDSRTSDETFDARAILELGVIAATIGRVDPARLTALRARFTEMAALLGGDRFVDFDGYMEANFVFHAQLVDLAENPLLTAAYNRLAIKSTFVQSFWSTLETSQDFVDAQLRLVEAIEAGDEEGARQAIRHYSAIVKRRARDLLSRGGGQV